MGAKIFTAVIVLLFLYIVSPLIVPLSMGAVFAVLFFPWLEKLERKKMPTSLASAFLTIGVTLGFVVPGGLLLFLGTKTGLQQLRVWKESPKSVGGGFFENMVNSPGVSEIIQKISTWFPLEVKELASTAEDLARSIGVRLADFLGDFFSHLPGMVMGGVVMVVSIYFFLVDGRRLVIFIRRHSVFNPDQTERMIHSFASMCRSVILASVGSGIVQALLFTAACLATGTSNALLIGFLVFLASFVPLVGSAPLTFGVALQQIFLGNKTAAIILLVMAIIVAAADNFIRPVILKGAANLHPLVAFTAAFGGLQVFGFTGVFLGPIIAALFVTTLQILLNENKPTLI